MYLCMLCCGYFAVRIYTLVCCTCVNALLYLCFCAQGFALGEVLFF